MSARGAGTDRAARIAAATNRAARHRRSSVILARLHAALFRRSGGLVAPRFFGAPVAVLEIRGRKSGNARRTPVIAMPDGEDLVLMAANAGSEKDPQWLLNLRAAGEAQVTERRRRRAMRARFPAGTERDELRDRFTDFYPSAAHYPRYTNRELPIVVLEPSRNATADSVGREEK